MKLIQMIKQTFCEHEHWRVKVIEDKYYVIVIILCKNCNKIIKVKTKVKFYRSKK